MHRQPDTALSADYNTEHDVKTIRHRTFFLPVPADRCSHYEIYRELLKQVQYPLSFHTSVDINSLDADELCVLKCSAIAVFNIIRKKILNSTLLVDEFELHGILGGLLFYTAKIVIHLSFTTDVSTHDTALTVCECISMFPPMEDMDLQHGINSVINIVERYIFPVLPIDKESMFRQFFETALHIIVKTLGLDEVSDYTWPTILEMKDSSRETVDPRNARVNEYCLKTETGIMTTTLNYTCSDATREEYRVMNKTALHEIYSTFWDCSHINFTTDCDDYNKCSPILKAMLRRVLAYFLIADTAIIDNIAFSQLTRDENIYSALFRGIMFLQEIIHTEFYSMNVTHVTNWDINEIHDLSKHELIQKKNDWAYGFVDDPRDKSLCVAIVEGVFFCNGFAFAHWLKHQKMFETTTTGIEYITRDENLHCFKEAIDIRFGNYINDETMRSKFIGMLNWAVDIELKFFNFVIADPHGFERNAQIADWELNGTDSFKYQDVIALVSHNAKRLCDNTNVVLSSDEPVRFSRDIDPASFPSYMLTTNRFLSKTNRFEHQATEYKHALF